MSSTDYEFEWDDAKAAGNLAKHGVDFNEAMDVFLDPLLMTRYDEDHSEDEERWVSLGRPAQGRLLLVVHTFVCYQRYDGADPGDFRARANPVRA